MIFTALACDYDGTLASADRIGPEALAALEHARAAGLRLILVTGRTFFELTRVCERLDLFDAVVVENGAVLYLPRAGMIRDLAPSPPARLLAELDRRGISYQAGRVVVGTLRSDEDRVRQTLAAAGVSLELVYNRAALMLLPGGVSKGTGVRQVIRELGLSPHDVLAIGDAENDLDLFEVCGFAGCPANAVPILKERADWVFPGEDGRSVAQAILGPILGETLLLDRSPRHRLALGWAVGTSARVSVPARGVNVLIQGNALSGKSWLAGALVERLVGERYAVCVIDPEGDFGVLARLPGVTWAEVRDEASLKRALGEFDRDPAACVVTDLSTLPHTKKVKLIETGLDLIRRRRRRLGLPHWVVLDEAHYSLHGEGIREAAIGLEAKGFCLVTYKPSWLRASVVKELDVVVLGRTTAPEELVFLRAFLTGPGEGTERVIGVLPDLPLGEFVVIQPDAAAGWTALTFTPTLRQTPHVRHLRKYADSHISPEERFFFRRPDGQLVATADSLSGFRTAVATVEDAVLASHAGRGDFSRWMFDVFQDRTLGRQIRKLETRWSRGEISDLRRAIEQLIVLRYGTER